ncbi:hypothetical protein AK812_SmicGene1889 [Symbiodinium microadriaticum]|uniref:Uncharacterized protein n=1 Tax=Symbiodinium microadriaticum TaxID=2951 RepID=A0A1Q9F2W4_SYMMI|nr:hypothetical protein AK812_SmicGene1889 [Symbiodinium microadriaticum]CAE7529587.1 unnamed protein product [Symbiodinium microadriaticum]
MDPVPHVLRGLPLWWQTLIRENYGWALQDGYMQDENRRRDLDFFQIYSGDGQDRVLSEYQKAGLKAVGMVEEMEAHMCQLAHNIGAWTVTTQSRSSENRLFQCATMMATMHAIGMEKEFFMMGAFGHRHVHPTVLCGTNIWLLRSLSALGKNMDLKNVFQNRATTVRGSGNRGEPCGDYTMTFARVASLSSRQVWFPGTEVRDDCELVLRNLVVILLGAESRQTSDC